MLIFENPFPECSYSKAANWTAQYKSEKGRIKFKTNFVGLFLLPWKTTKM